MNNDKQQLFKQALQRQNEKAAKMKMPEDMERRVMERINRKQSNRHWIYALSISSAAALIILFFTFGNVITHRNGGSTELIAQSDSTRPATTPTISKEKNHPQSKKGNKETVDTVRTMMEKYRMPRPPKHYMAKQQTKTKEQSIQTGPTIISESANPSPADVGNATEPYLVEAKELMEKTLEEEKNKMIMEMTATYKNDIQGDYQDLKKEIRQRGERFAQQTEMALNEDF